MWCTFIFNPFHASHHPTHSRHCHRLRTATTWRTILSRENINAIILFVSRCFAQHTLINFVITLYIDSKEQRHNCERIITISLSSFNVSSRTYFYYSMHLNCINYQIFVHLSKSNENLASKILQVSTQKCSKGRGNNNEKIVEEKKGGKSNYPTQNALSLLDRPPHSLTSDSQTRIFSRTNFKVIGCRGKNKYWETSWTSNLLLVSLVKFSIYSALSPPPLTHKFIQTKHIFPWQDIAANQTLLLESLIPSN